MKSDALLFMAYDYGAAIGRSASEVLQLPIAEIMGYYSYLRCRDQLNG